MSSTTLGQVIATFGGSIQTGPFGTVLKASEYSEYGVPIISVGEVGYGTLRLRPETPRAPQSVVHRLPSYVLQHGDIVFGRKGAVDRSAWVQLAEDGWFLGSDGIRVRFSDGVSSRFISYQLRTEETRAWLLQHAAGSTMPSLNEGVLARIPLDLPPLAVQLAIVEVLGALDDKIAANTKLARTVDKLACALFAGAVRQVRPSSVTFGELSAVGGGGTPSTSVPEYWNGDVNWATPTDITALQGPYLRHTSRTITAHGLDNCASPLYPAGSILMTSRATIGSFALARVPTTVNQGFITVMPNDDGERYWLFHEMRSRVDEFIAFANGATFLELSRGNFKKFKVRLADTATITSFNAHAAALHDSANEALTENDALAATRDALLPHLMAGRLRVKDAETIAEDVL